MSINVSYPTSIQGSTSVLGSAYFFDIFPTASAAYSTRKLSRTATYCMKVRRTSDNATQDIGFTGGVNGGLDLNALITFAAGSDLLVNTWYDQSGNGRNAVQTNTSIQPAIYYGGGFPGFGSGPYLSINFQGSLAAGGNTYGYFSLSSALGITNGGYYFNAYVSSYRDTNDTTQPWLFYWSCNGAVGSDRHSIRTGAGAAKQYYNAYSRTNSSDTLQTTISNISNQQTPQIITMLSSTNNTAGTTPYLNIYQNGVLGGTGGNIGGAIENANSAAALLGRGVGNEWNGYMAEALFYNIDTTPYKAAMEQNINSTFQIY
jgi:hypothetical protein